MLEKKYYVIVRKGGHKQNLQLAKVFVTAFKVKHPNVNIGFSKFCAYRPKWFVLAGSKITHSACV